MKNIIGRASACCSYDKVVTSDATKIRVLYSVISNFICALPINCNINCVGKTKIKKKEADGKSYKGSMIVNYDSRVVIWGNFKSGTTLES